MPVVEATEAFVSRHKYHVVEEKHLGFEKPAIASWSETYSNGYVSSGQVPVLHHLFLDGQKRYYRDAIIEYIEVDGDTYRIHWAWPE